MVNSYELSSYNYYNFGWINSLKAKNEGSDFVVIVPKAFNFLNGDHIV